jgi:eukaryotic-like serine/threonine-protein kinase
MAGSTDTIFGRLALERSFCSEVELKDCRAALKEISTEKRPALASVMVKKGYITKSQAARLLDEIKKQQETQGQIPGYEIIEKIGSGAMAIVYKAKQKSLDRTVAIKVLPHKFAAKDNYVDRFYKEGQLAARLNHNNIVQAIDVGQASGLYYFVMEYVEGKSIYDDLAAGKIFSEKEALEIILQLARALEHAHAQGLIHRDIKPKNIMITKDGTVKLADLGLARTTSDVEAAENEKGKAFGTPFYIAPEQIRGDVNIDGRADIYGLGATFYHMVTGQVPYNAPNPKEVMKKHLTETLTPPDHINVSLSAGVAIIIETMMAKNPGDRYQNPSDLVEDLEAVSKGNPPVFATKRVDIDTLSELESGSAVVIQGDTRMYPENVITRYRIICAVLGAVILLLVLLMFFGKGGS